MKTTDSTSYIYLCGSKLHLTYVAEAIVALATVEFAVDPGFFEGRRIYSYMPYWPPLGLYLYLPSGRPTGLSLVLRTFDRAMHTPFGPPYGLGTMTAL